MQGAGKLIASVNLPTTDKALQYTANVDWRGYPTPDAANADLLLSANGSDTEHNFDVKLSHPRSKIDLAGKAKLGTNLIDIQLKQLAINAEKQKLNLHTEAASIFTMLPRHKSIITWLNLKKVLRSLKNNIKYSFVHVLIRKT